MMITRACCSSSSLLLPSTSSSLSKLDCSMVLDSDKPSIKDNGTSFFLSHNVESVGVVGSMIADLSLDLLWISWACSCCEPDWLSFSGFVCLFDSMSQVGQVGWFCCWLFEINWVLFEFLGFWVFECLRFLGFLWCYDFGYESLGTKEKDWWVFSMDLWGRRIFGHGSLFQHSSDHRSIIPSNNFY